MKFKDLEIGQTFRQSSGGVLCTKTRPGAYEFEGAPEVFCAKRGRAFDVIPEGEPPSAIEAARRDTRWWILDNMEVTAAEVRATRDSFSVGIIEAQKKLKRAKLQGGLDVLKYELQDVDEKTQRVLHDLIEIVRELV